MDTLSELAQRCDHLQQTERALLFEIRSLEAKVRVLRESRGVDVQSLQDAFDKSSATEVKELRLQKGQLEQKLAQANEMVERLVKRRRSTRLSVSSASKLMNADGGGRSDERKGRDEDEKETNGGDIDSCGGGVAAVLVRRLRPRQMKEVIYRAWGSEGLAAATAEKLSGRDLQDRCIAAAEAVVSRGTKEDGEDEEVAVKDISGWL